jgi:hypothetical protein
MRCAPLPWRSSPPGARSWTGGGGLWDPPSFDSQGDIYIGVANPGPIGQTGWPRGYPWGTSRPGPNLYTDSVVKLSPQGRVPGRVPLLADPLGRPRPLHLALLVLAGLGEHRQQHDPLARCQPVADPHLTAARVKPQLADLATEVARIRLA